MNIDLGSFAYGGVVLTGGNTPSWGTSLGQSQPDYKFTYPGAENILIGMMYCSTPLQYVSLPLGKGGRVFVASELSECQLASLFKKVYINETRIDYPFLMVLIREESASHTGRRTIKYSDKTAYNDGISQYNNQQFVKQARLKLGLADEACWFIYSMEVINQDELHMYAAIVDANNSVDYPDSQTRRQKWLDLLDTELKDNYQTYARKQDEFSESESLQQIFYGAPGTGKSHWIKKRLKELEVSKENIFRTTFHPDSDYSTFVGAYKPTMKKQYRYDGKVKAKYYEDDDLADAKKDDVIVDKVIQYDFIPQTFVKAYVRAYQTTDNVYLVIEEINRGNCAQIFGDLFQLLDRDENGVSEYTIKADTDLRTYLEDALGKDADGIKDGELCLPSNLYIWATMNTSDQSLFPIDSAFKRRWDWKYEPIKYENTNWKIEIGGTKYLWTDFQRKVNSGIFDDTSSEDKMLGDYFVNPPTGIISEDLFLNKILFYLWNDVCKDGDGDIFKTEDNKDVKFSDLYGENGTTILLSMMRHLKVDPIDGTSDDNDEEEENEAEGSTPKRYSINGEETNKDGKNWGKGALVKRAVEIYCEKYPSETAEQIRDAWMSVGFKIPHLIETKDDKERRITGSKDKTGRERAREIILSNGESIYVSTEVGSGAVLDGFGDFLTKIQSKPEWGISIQEL